MHQESTQRGRGRIQGYPNSRPSFPHHSPFPQSPLLPFPRFIPLLRTQKEEEINLFREFFYASYISGRSSLIYGLDYGSVSLTVRDRMRVYEIGDAFILRGTSAKWPALTRVMDFCMIFDSATTLRKIQNSEKETNGETCLP